MGQVVAFPKHKRRPHERLAATLQALYAVTYVLGFFILGPCLVMFGFAFAFSAQPLAALICVGALLVVWAVTRAAWVRL